MEQAFFYAPFAAVTGGVVLLINVFAAKNSPTLSSSAIKEDVQRCFETLHVLSEKQVEMSAGSDALTDTFLIVELSWQKKWKEDSKCW